jgi:hypothetical protein
LKPIFPLVLPPAAADAASATIMRRASELLRVIAKHLLDGSDSGRQTEGAVPMSAATFVGRGVGSTRPLDLAHGETEIFRRRCDFKMDVEWAATKITVSQSAAVTMTITPPRSE